MGVHCSGAGALVLATDTTARLQPPSGQGLGGAALPRRVELAQRPDLLEALRKPPGVFYLPRALATARLTPEAHVQALAGVPVLELSGGSDFEAGAQACLDFLQS